MLVFSLFIGLTKLFSLFAGCGDQTHEFIPEFPAVRVADLPEELVLGDLESLVSKMLREPGINDAACTGGCHATHLKSWTQ